MGNTLSMPSSFVKNKYKTFTAIIILGVLYSIWKRRAKPHPNIPMSESSKTPFFGDLWRFLHAIGKDNPTKTFHETVVVPSLKANNNYNILATSQALIPGLPRPRYTIQLYHPKLVERIFTDISSFQKTHLIHEPLEELFGDGIFSSDPPKWRWHRKVASRIFSMRNLKDHIFGCGVKNAVILIDKMREYKNKNINDGIIDIHDLLGRFTLQSFVESAFGEHLEIIESAPNIQPFNNAFDKTLNLLLLRYGDPFWKLKRKYGIGQREGYDIPNNFKILNGFVYDVIASRKNKQLFTDETGNEKYDLLSLFLKHRDTNPDDTGYDKEIRDIAMNFITAARDTTKVLLSWFFYAITLDKNKDILRRLRKEIDGNYFDINDNELTPRELMVILPDLMPKDITDAMIEIIVGYIGEYGEDMNELKYDDKFVNGYKYLTATLLETLRYHPSVPYLPRYAIKGVDIEFEGNTYTIHKGSQVVVHCYSYSRMKHIFGDDAEEFKPMRFYEKGLNTFNVYQYPYFNVNPRLCLGRNVAIVQAKIVAILVLRNFVIKPVKNQNVAAMFSLIHSMKDGFKIKVI